MAKTLLRDKARLLRRRGRSLNEITSQLAVAKSTVRFWCRDIILTDFQQKRLYEKKRIGGIRAAENMRARRMVLTENIQRQAVKEIGKTTQRDLLMAGIALYWAEGYRKGDGEFGFTNSDPAMIKIIVRWLKEVCVVSEERIHFRICINAGQKYRIHAVLKFWQRTLRVSEKKFSKPTFIQTKNKKEFLNSENYFGTLRVKVRRSTDLRRKIIGWISGLALSMV